MWVFGESTTCQRGYTFRRLRPSPSVVGEDVQWLRQKEHTMAETYEVPEYIPGDHVELRLYLRHKHNVVAVEAGFAHESNSNVSFTRRNAPELERHEGDEKVSVVR